jgi:hypothetical protein
VLAALISGFISGEAVAALQRAKRAAVAYTIAAVFGMFGIGFLLVAAYIAAAQRIGPVYAGLAFGGAFLLVAVLVVLISRIGSERAVRKTSRKRNREMSRIAVTTGLALLPTLMRGRVGKAALIAPAIAAIIYGIYRENSRPSAPEDPLD